MTSAAAPEDKAAFLPPSHAVKAEEVRDVLSDRGTLLLAGPRLYGKAKVLERAVTGVEPPMGASWVVARCDVERIGARVARGEIGLEQGLRDVLRQLFSRALPDGVGLESVLGRDLGAGLVYVLDALERPVVAVLGGVEGVDERFFGAFINALRSWLPSLDEQAEPWNRVRFVLLSHLDAQPIIDRHALYYAYSWAGRWRVMELGELGEDDMRAVGAARGARWSDDEIGVLRKKVGGHPYLVELMAGQAERGVSVGDLARRAHETSGPLAPLLKAFFAALHAFSRVYGQGTKTRQRFPALEIAADVGAGSLSGVDEEVKRFYASWGVLRYGRTGEIGSRGEYRYREPRPEALLLWLERQ
jgi:hypothetical protein